MINLKDIFKIIYREKIILEEINSSTLDGIYVKCPDTAPIIDVKAGLDTNNSKKYISILSEELGHYFTTYGNLTCTRKSYLEKINRDKKENSARSWAANFLISDSDFVNALNNCVVTYSDVAEYFNVTEEIVNIKVKSIISDEDKYNSIKDNFKNKEIQYQACSI